MRFFSRIKHVSLAVAQNGIVRVWFISAMIDLKKLQQRVYDNKVKKGFNTVDVHEEFCWIHEEVSEACRAYHDKLPNVGEELADVAIYLLGLSEILGVDLENEIVKKVDKNEKREYQRRDGVIARTKEV